MKTFSETTNIKDTLQCNAKLVLSPVGECNTVVSINDNVLYCGLMTSKITLTHSIPLNNSIDIAIVVERTHPAAVVIDKLSVDGIEILPKYQHTATPPTTYLDTNTVWLLKIAPSFYPWHHTVSGQGLIINFT